MGSEAISARYLVTYPDGSRKHIDRETRDSLLLSQLIRKTQDTKYRYIGPVRTFHSFAELDNLYVPAHQPMLKRFLAGCFLFELKGRKYSERMETPEGMALRMAKA